MPDMDGPETAQAILDVTRFYGEKYNAKEFSLPYICCLTGYTDNVYANTAMAAGMNDFKTKPMDSEALDSLFQQLNIKTSDL